MTNHCNTVDRNLEKYDKKDKQNQLSSLLADISKFLLLLEKH